MKQFLDWKFSQWRGSDRKKNMQDFAEYLGVEYPALEHWMSGRRNPKRENVDKLAEKLGPEVYDVAGLARPTNGMSLDEIAKQHFFAAFGDLGSEEDRAAIEGLYSLSFNERLELVKRAWRERSVLKKERRERAAVSRRRGEPSP